MALHFVSATRLANRLASGTVGAREQAQYVVISSLLWLFFGYLPILETLSPGWASRPYGPLEPWSIGPLGLWVYELALLVIINVVGVFYCLANCTTDPKRHFLIDFSCLMTPITVTTLVGVWAAFYIYASAIPLWIQVDRFDSEWMKLLYSLRFLDLMRFLATVVVSFLIFLRVGNHMSRVSAMRKSASRGIAVEP